jgi:hypothetical protein
MEIVTRLREPTFLEVDALYPANGQIERFVRRQERRWAWDGVVHSYNRFNPLDRGEEFILREGRVLERHPIPPW